MTRYFNTEGSCKPNEHYMVRLDDRLAQIKELFVDRGKYFIINRGRQYGAAFTGSFCGWEVYLDSRRGFRGGKVDDEIQYTVV